MRRVKTDKYSTIVVFNYTQSVYLLMDSVHQITVSFSQENGVTDPCYLSIGKK